MDSPMALLDSGATHALRAAESEKEWLESELVKVTLAGGQSVNMRMNAASKTEKGSGHQHADHPHGRTCADFGAQDGVGWQEV